MRGIIIGKKGAGIDDLKRKTGAFIWVATQQEMHPGSEDRLVTIRGDPDQVEEALESIKDKVGGRPLEEGTTEATRWPMRGAAGAAAGMKISGPNVELFMVPIRSIGVILGSGGSEIKRITAETGANIQIAQTMFLGDTERTVTISGTDSAREKARAMLSEQVDKWREQQADPLAEDICLKTVLPQALIGHIMGRSGTFMRSVQAVGVNIKLYSEKASFNRLCDFRPVMILGKIEAIFEAQKMLHERIQSAPEHLIQEALALPPSMQLPPSTERVDDYSRPTADRRGADPSSLVSNIVPAGQVIKEMTVDGQKVIVVQAPSEQQSLAQQQAQLAAQQQLLQQQALQLQLQSQHMQQQLAAQAALVQGGMGAGGMGAVATSNQLPIVPEVVKPVPVAVPVPVPTATPTAAQQNPSALSRVEIGLNGIQLNLTGADLFIHPAVMKYVVGVNGSTIKHISQKSNCVFRVQEKDEVDPRQPGVKVSIQGPQESVALACSLIEQTLEVSLNNAKQEASSGQNVQSAPATSNPGGGSWGAPAAPASSWGLSASASAQSQFMASSQQSSGGITAARGSWPAGGSGYSAGGSGYSAGGSAYSAGGNAYSAGGSAYSAGGSGYAR